MAGGAFFLAESLCAEILRVSPPRERGHTFRTGQDHHVEAASVTGIL